MTTRIEPIFEGRATLYTFIDPLDFVEMNQTLAAFHNEHVAHSTTRAPFIVDITGVTRLPINALSQALKMRRFAHPLGSKGVIVVQQHLMRQFVLIVTRSLPPPQLLIRENYEQACAEIEEYLRTNPEIPTLDPLINR